MSLIDFPSSPSLGQNYTFNGRTWEWNGYAWDIIGLSGGGGGGGFSGNLYSLNDVNLVNLSSGQALLYNGAYWINENIVNSLNGEVGDVLALSNIPTPDPYVSFDANLGTISNLSYIEGNNGDQSVLTVIGDLVVTGSIIASNPYSIILGDTVDTNPEDIDGGQF